MKAVKTISWFLGIVMFVFGILKVIIPTINGWYSVQIISSGLREYIPMWLSITGEIVIGLTLIITLIKSQNLPTGIFWIIIQVASAIVIFMMLVAIYVHLQPNVPADVLPLKIKAPYIPIFILLLALTNFSLAQKQKKELNIEE